MAKRTCKLLVYLDQNFLSAMAKAGSHDKVNPLFSDIYELLHQGFLDEKLVVPASVLHDIESSLATHLKDRIGAYQGYLGQVRLRRPDEIWNRQIEAVLAGFSGRAAEDALDPELAFLDDPDQRVERRRISVDAHLERFDFRGMRHRTAQDLERLRLRLLSNGIGYDQQLKTEQQEQRDHFLGTYFRFCHPLSDEQRQRFIDFAKGPGFAQIPLLTIEARLYAAVLTQEPTRSIKPSDAADIEILSAYVPYMDVVCTDAFMADLLRSLAIEREFGVVVFHAKANSLGALKAFLESFLPSATPAHRPSITVFVLPPRQGREQAAGFFRRLADAARAMGTVEYGETFAFDDGAMPRYAYPQLPGKTLPFYGLADVTPLDLPHGATELDILKICRAKCRSSHFVLIDEYKDIANTFMLGAAVCAESGRDTVEGYRIFKTRP
jgi:hypothetical protein